MTTTFMSFNLRMDTPDDGVNAWHNRVDKVVKVIRKHNPDVFGVQEVFKSMLEDLDKHFSSYRWIGEGRRGGSEDEFSAIFYDAERVECLDHGQFWLSEEPEIPNSISWDSSLPRICTWGHFKLKAEPNHEFFHFNTHLDHAGEQARQNGIHLIGERMKAAKKQTGLPIILTGDFNSYPDAVSIQYLKGLQSIKGDGIELIDAFDVLNTKPGGTFHGFTGKDNGQPIDYIFCSSEVEIVETIIDRTSFDQYYPSDHYPVIAKVKTAH